MDKQPWAKYYFSICIVAVLTSLVAKYLTPSPLILIPFAIGLYWLTVKGFSRVKGY